MTYSDYLREKVTFEEFKNSIENPENKIEDYCTSFTWVMRDGLIFLEATVFSDSTTPKILRSKCTPAEVMQMGSIMEKALKEKRLLPSNIRTFPK